MTHVKKTFTVHTVTSTDPTGKRRTMHCTMDGSERLLKSLGYTDITETEEEMVLTMPISEFREHAKVMENNKNNVVARSLPCYELTMTDKDGNVHHEIVHHFEESLKSALENAGYQVAYQKTVKKFYVPNVLFASLCLEAKFPDEDTETQNK